MMAGHFGLAAAVKAKAPELPLWSLMLGTQLLDVLFVPLYLSGIETMEPVFGGGYGENLIHADYTHSLVGALLIAILSGLGAWRLWGQRGGAVIGSLVFSHWLLDLLVHRADMPILPGNLGDLPLLGFGLWRWPAASAAAEALLIAAGGIMYAVSLWRQAAVNRRGAAMLAGSVMLALLASVLIMDVG